MSVGAFITGLVGLSPSAARAAILTISVKAQFSDHVKTRLISQLVNRMPKVL